MSFRHRSAATGRFVTEQFAKIFKRKTIRETVKPNFEQEFANICSQFVTLVEEHKGEDMDAKWQEYFKDVMVDIIERRNKP